MIELVVLDVAGTTIEEHGSVYDALEAAVRAAGAAIVVGVLTGAQDAAGLSTVPHTRILPGVAQIPDLISPN